MSNISTMTGHIASRGINLRPHVKTCKSFDSLPIGSRVRVLPNHACMTAAMYGCYHVVDGDSDIVKEIWSRTNGWQAPGFQYDQASSWYTVT